MPGIIRTIGITCPLVCCLGAHVKAADSPLPPAAKVTFAAASLTPSAVAGLIREQTGIDLDVSDLDQSPVMITARTLDFWAAIDQLAAGTKSRLVVSSSKFKLRTGTPRSPSSTAGPFRISVREVAVRSEPDAGTSHYTLTVEVAWHPGVHAYRIDTVPQITSATDDLGTVLTFAGGGSRTFTAGVTAPVTVRPQGLTRKSQSLNLAGSVRVTIADELLTFTFDATAKPGTGRTEKGVEVVPVRFGPDGNDWVAEIVMRYPKGSAEWESHEFYWARNNVLELVSPRGEAVGLTPTEFQDGSLRYVFKNRARQVGPGWSFRYRTPGPMREVTVPFELKGIPLP